MPLTAPDIWTVTPSATWREGVRTDLDARLGLALDYVGTIDGAWSAQAAELAFQVDQRVSEAFAASLLATAPRPVVIARARDRGLTPREATASTIEAELATGSGGVLPVGTELRVREGTVSIVDTDAGGVTVPLESSWVVIENDNAGELLGVSDTVILECATPGRVSVDSAITLSPLLPITGIGTLTNDGTMRSTGREAEQLPELRQRLVSSRAVRGGSPVGLAAEIRDLPWVVAFGIDETPGEVRVTVAPAPPTAAHALELGEAIYRARATGALPVGTQTVTVEAADGRDFEVGYEVGQTVTVDVAFTVLTDSSATQADARRLVRAAIDTEFARLGAGDPIRYLRAFAALNQPGILGGTLTLNGGVVDVFPPSSADALVPVYP